MRYLSRQNRCLPVARVEQQDPLLGLDMLKMDLYSFQSKAFLKHVQRRHQELGRTWGYVTMGKLTINSIEPVNLHQVLNLSSSEFELGQNRMNVIGPSIGHGLLTMDGDMSRNARKLSQPGFKAPILRRVPFEQYVQKLFKKLPTDNKTVVDLQPLFYRFAFGVSSDLIFGHSVDTLAIPESTKEASDLEHAFEKIEAHVADLMTRGQAAVWFPKKEHLNGLPHIINFIDKKTQLVLSAACEEKCMDFEPSMIDVFASQTQDKETIRGQLSHIVIAGRDTTGSLLSHLFFELSRHPKVWSKLRTEISGLEGVMPDPEQLSSYRYLRQCLDETLRLYPAAIFINRRACQDVVLPRGGGDDGLSPMVIEKGVELTVLLFVMHRLEEYFGPDTDCFVPERWDVIKPGHAFAPFGAGRRICIGRQFAYNETTDLTIRMLQHFSKIRSTDDKPWVEGLGAILGNGRGTAVTLESAC